MGYNTIYQNKNVWGIEPNKLLLKIFSFEKFEKPGEYFLDLGCGQARESAEKSQLTRMHTKGPWDKGRWANRK